MHSFFLLPPEILDTITEYNRDDYRTLFSCTLVNKYWHNITTPILWRDPFYSAGSIMVLVLCLMAEDRGFFARNNVHKYQYNKISLSKNLLPPTQNYAKYASI